MKMKFGALVTDGRGKIGGHVASKNRAGAYLRTKVTPSNPQTSFQSVVRNRLGSLAQAWRGLTVAQRDAWNAAVGDFQRTDVFGDLKSPTGLNLYTRLNSMLLNVGIAALDTPPSPSAVFAFDSLSLAASSDAGLIQAVTLTFSAAIPAGTSVIVKATPPMSAGISNPGTKFRQIAVIDDADTSPADVVAAYTAKFGNGMPVGSKVFVELVTVDETTGIAGVPLRAAAIATQV